MSNPLYYVRYRAHEADFSKKLTICGYLMGFKSIAHHFKLNAPDNPAI